MAKFFGGENDLQKLYLYPSCYEKNIHHNNLLVTTYRCACTEDK